jgi:hypothetical protein
VPEHDVRVLRIGRHEALAQVQAFLEVEVDNLHLVGDNCIEVFRTAGTDLAQKSVALLATVDLGLFEVGDHPAATSE